MENKISIGSLSSALSLTTGKSKKLCEDFLREFFKLIPEVLLTEENVRIKGLGTFKLVDVEARTGINVTTGMPQEIAAYKKVAFTPAKELASALNAPFEEFESVELDDEIPEEVFYEEPKNLEEEEIIAKEEELSNENDVSEERLEEGSDEEDSDDIITYEAYRDIEEQEQKVEPQSVSAPDSGIEQEQPAEKKENLEPQEEIPAGAPVINPAPFEPQYDYYEEEPQKSRFGIGFLLGSLSMFAVCAVIFMLGCFFDWWPVNFGNGKAIVENVLQQNEPQETEEEVIPEEEVQQEPVYDTVSTTRFLTTIAREHYGNFNFWPYIYLENESILGHPDRITPGTKVVVPDLKKYGVDTSNPEDVKKAKELSQEIYGRFR